MFLAKDERTALEQIQDFLTDIEGISHKGYFSYGWAGQQLTKLLERDVEESKGNG